MVNPRRRDGLVKIRGGDFESNEYARPRLYDTKNPRKILDSETEKDKKYETSRHGRKYDKISSAHSILPRFSFLRDHSLPFFMSQTKQSTN